MSRWERTPEAEPEPSLWTCDPGTAGSEGVWAGFPERFELPPPDQSRRRPSSGIRTCAGLFSKQMLGVGLESRVGGNSGFEQTEDDKPRVEARHVNGWR